MPSSGAFWRIRGHPRAAPLDKEEPRNPVKAKFAELVPLSGKFSEYKARRVSACFDPAGDRVR
jgi:hypothetical protein